MTAPPDSADVVRLACTVCEHQEEVPAALAASRSDCPKCGGAVVALRVGARSSEDIAADRARRASAEFDRRDLDAEEFAAQSAAAAEAKHRAKLRARLDAAERNRRAKRAVLLGIVALAVGFGAFQLWDRWDRERRVARELAPDAALALARETLGRRVAVVRPFSTGPGRHFVAVMLRPDSGTATIRMMEGVEGQYVVHPVELPADVDTFAEGVADPSITGADRWERPALVDLHGDGSPLLYAYAYLPVDEAGRDSAYRVQLYLPNRGTVLWLHGPPKSPRASETLREGTPERRFLTQRLRELGR